MINKKMIALSLGMFLVLSACSFNIQGTVDDNDNQVPPTGNVTPQTPDEKTPPAVTPPAATIPPVSTADWLTYRNEKYWYMFNYPHEAQIKEADKNSFNMTPAQYQSGVTLDSLMQQYTGKICIRAELGNGYVAIAAPANQKPDGDTIAMCMRTGAGVCSPASQRNGGTVGNFDETFIIGNRNYEAKGITQNCPGDAQPYSQSARLKLDDGTYIEYGGYANSQADFLALKAKLVKIIESYKKLVKPL